MRFYYTLSQTRIIEHLNYLVQNRKITKELFCSYILSVEQGLNKLYITNSTNYMEELNNYGRGVGILHDCKDYKLYKVTWKSESQPLLTFNKTIIVPLKTQLYNPNFIKSVLLPKRGNIVIGSHKIINSFMDNESIHLEY